ncbi:MAG: hypothetical protein V3S01_09340 [Dehalococcoidia bacterium]
MKILALLLALIPLAAGAVPSRVNQQPLILLDGNCTDSFSEPSAWGPLGVEGQSGVDANDFTTFDTVDTAITYLSRIGSPAQTSGSADGLCDANPLTVKGDFTTTLPVTELYFAPFPSFSRGTYFLGEANDTAGDWRLAFVIESPLTDGETVVIAESDRVISTDTDMQVLYFGPTPVNSESTVNAATFALPQGYPNTLRLQLEGVGTYNINVIILPVKRTTP